jgi:hypothetical protein
MRWYVLVHQLPPRPPYLRAKIGQRLARVGALPIKNSIYLLPRKADCLEDFQWIASEAQAGGGEAHVLEAAFTDAGASDALRRRFQSARRADYRKLAAEVRRVDGGRPTSPEGIAANLARSRRRLEEIRRIDYFHAPGRKEVESMMRHLEGRLHRDGGEGRTGGGGHPAPDLVGKTWVTRRGVKVDRIASAWLVRRFVDPRARFRFVDPKTSKGRPGELRFDMVGGDFTHEGDHCTFETLVSRAGIRDKAVGRIAEIVHDIDLKDGKFGRPETSGIQRLIEGLIAAHSTDKARLERGSALFDDLYASFGAPSSVS